MENTAIEVKDLSITYKTLQRFSLRRLSTLSQKQPAKGFTAVKNVSFSVEGGEIIGIIGRNGSGKSTLLRSIAGIFSPDEGSVNTFGKTVSLLAIGVGFQNNLSGRENIFLSGLLLGFTKKEIEEKTEEIIEFSELGDFIDKPIKTYSSGMHSKLAFSITACLEAEIMLIDEIFSVGDASFRKKSYAKMKELILKKDRTVVMVSHSMAPVQELCNRVLWLHDGEMRMLGGAAEVIGAYEGKGGN